MPTGIPTRAVRIRANTASCTVTYQGLLYPLAHDTLTSGGVLMGVSNTITADTAVIRVHAGTALVVVYTA